MNVQFEKVTFGHEIIFTKNKVSLVNLGFYFIWTKQNQLFFNNAFDSWYLIVCKIESTLTVKFINFHLVSSLMR